MVYFKYVKMLFATFLQYRLNMLFVMLGQVFGTLFMFAGIYLLFERFGTLDGYTLGEVALCFAVVTTAFAIAECFARGFDMFSSLVRSGAFDRIMLRPRSTILQVLGARVELTRIGRLAVSIAVLAYASSLLNIAWNALQVLTVVFMAISGAFIFFGVLILGATVCFWTVEGLEFINIFTNGGQELSAYPLTIYNKWISRFFTFAIPLGCVNYLPLLYVTGRSDNPLYALTPLLGIAFIIPCLIVWRFGVRHYLSTGN
jgi:ABC-2 type transport system permease protein